MSDGKGQMMLRSLPATHLLLCGQVPGGLGTLALNNCPKSGRTSLFVGEDLVASIIVTTVI